MAVRLNRHELQRIADILVSGTLWSSAQGRSMVLDTLLRDVPATESQRLRSRIDTNGSPEFSAVAALLEIERAGEYEAGRPYLAAFLLALSEVALDHNDKKYLKALAAGLETAHGTNAVTKTFSAQMPASELAERLEKRLSRAEVAVLWYRLFGRLITDDIPAASLSEATIALVDRASRYGKSPELIDAIRTQFPHVLTLPL